MQRYKRWLAVVGLVVVAGVGAAACQSSGPSAPSAQAKENTQQAADSTSLINNQPIPGLNYSQLRQNLIEIETAQANGVQTTSFFFNQGVQDPIFVCPSIGFPIPNTASLSNPEQIIQADGGYQATNSVPIPQMDPNGIYAPTSSSGTYAICVGADGKPFAKYWEGFVDAVTGPAKWDEASHTEQMLGPSSFTFSTSKATAAP